MPLLADVLPLPTGVADYLHFGPLGIAVGAALFVGAVFVARALLRRGRSRGAAIAAAIAFFVVCDLIAYVLAITVLRPPRPDRELPPPTARTP